MDRSPPTLYDVAREAGVSLATASRVVNGSARTVAASYRSRVLDAAERLGYRANVSAQAVARGTSAVVALLVSDIADPYFSALASGVTRAAEEEGLLVTIAETRREPVRELRVLQQLSGLRPRLFVLSGSRSTGADDEAVERAIAALATSGSDVVSIGRMDPRRPSVEIANREGARALAHRLVAAGCDEVAILAGPPGLVTAVERREGFEQGLAEAGGRLVDVVHGAFDRDGGAAAAAELLERRSAVRTVFAVNDVMAIGAMSTLRREGVAMPERIAVAGFDDIPSAADAVPALTTVRIDLETAGSLAVRVGLGVHGEPGPLPATPVLRASTALGRP